ncbi:MAG: phage terminase small subunit P27 family [Planctomycetes bacterium]|nr:phage terminase small subunit P27 family [Planctomycetota bacterium]
MGKRGPRPQPTRLLRLKGSWRGNINKHEPPTIAGDPTCPDWLDEEAKAMWGHVVPLLRAMNLLSKADGNALSRYCHLCSRWLKAEKFLQKYGESYPLKDAGGNVRCFMAWPQSSVAAKLARELARLEQEFGLTPSARSRLDVRYLSPEHHGQPSPVRDFFEGGGPRLRPPDPPSLIA